MVGFTLNQLHRMFLQLKSNYKPSPLSFCFCGFVYWQNVTPACTFIYSSLTHFFRLIKIKEWVDKNDPGALIIPFSGAFEHKLVEEYEDPALRKKFLEDQGTTR